MLTVVCVPHSIVKENTITGPGRTILHILGQRTEVELELLWIIDCSLVCAFYTQLYHIVHGVYLCSL
ncbi:Protein of unknown function [Gryllus bimaculatus]|nr:Protein of unknown function [Gryllus bimaculatus]